MDKPLGMTSHDVVARVRRLGGTRRVGHAGTLDPAASGVLVLGLGTATRLLGHLTRDDKEYAATIRLGESTTTDDAEGDVQHSASADGVTEEGIRQGVQRLTGAILQRPSSVSAIRVGGRRAHDLVRSGEDVALAERPVTVRAFEIVDIRRPGAVGRAGGEVVDVDVRVVCSAGTYVRALARDLGSDLGVGGHVTALRRTASGAFGIDDAVDLPRLEAIAGSGEPLPLLTPYEAVVRAMPVASVDAAAAARIRTGASIAWPLDPELAEETVIGLVRDRDLLALAHRSGSSTAYAAVFP